MFYTAIEMAISKDRELGSSNVKDQAVEMNYQAIRVNRRVCLSGSVAVILQSHHLIHLIHLASLDS